METSELLDRIDDLNQEKTKISSRREVLEEDVDSLDEDVDSLEDEVEDLKERKETLKKSSEVVKQVAEKVFKEKLGRYVKLVNDGLDTIFFDREMEFDVEIDDRGSKKTVSLVYRKKEDEDWTDWREIDNSSGACVRTICDMISRIFLIVVNDRQRLLLLDESLTEVSSKYVGKVVNFLQTIVDDLGFDILFVSHDDRFIQKIDSGYEMEEGDVKKL